MILLFQTLASAFLSTLFFVPEFLDYPKRNVYRQSQNNKQGKVGRSVLLINLHRPDSGVLSSMLMDVKNVFCHTYLNRRALEPD